MAKKQIIEVMFGMCRKRNNFVFDNNLVKPVVKECDSNTNPYDVPKIDDMSKLPEIVIKADYFVAHLGSGNHKFIKGINKVYHKDQVAVSYQNLTARRMQQRMAEGSNGRMPYSWWYYGLVKNVSKDKTFHSCQIPLGLVKMLIKSSTKETAL